MAGTPQTLSVYILLLVLRSITLPQDPILPTAVKMKMSSSVLSCCLLLLSVACYVSCYRSQVRRGGGYSLPPGVTPWNPGRHQGLPPAYHGKFKRSLLDEQDGGVLAADEPAQYAVFKRSLDDQTADFEAIEEPQAFQNSRVRRDYRIILPTYRPGPRRPPPVYRV